MARFSLSLSSFISYIFFFTSSASFAQPFNSTEARSLAMGDTGVASAKASSAAIFNPALLAEKPEGNIQIILPNVGVNVFADPDAVDAFENIEDQAYIDNITTGSDRINNSINTMDTNEFLAARQQVVDASQGLDDELSVLSEKPFRINAGAFASIAFPTRFAGMSAYISSNATIETTPVIDSCDRTTLDEYTKFLNYVQNEQDIETALRTGIPPFRYRCEGETEDRSILDEASATPALYDPTDDLASHVIVAGVTTTEFGLSLAKQFEFGSQKISFGITPKIQKITSYWAVPTVQDLDDENYEIEDEFKDSEKTENSFNADLGIATSFLAGDSLTLGLVIKNLIEQDYTTTTTENGVTGKYSIDRQARAGIAWQAPMGITLAADLDLTKNSALFLGDDTQYLALGAEWDIMKIVRLRAGLRENLENSADQSISAGLGFNIMAVHFDFAAQGGDNNAGGALQLGLAF
ncbi:conjugal transfer protein TraF [Agaribacterium sp. ZY112]|uniref:conjugal transfer protein TraF n=1 Tax=Agaribacterium sp. ZY112 TaxID=3233574 RepID=UPI0035260F42